MTAKLTLQQYDTIKSIWDNNNQGVTFEKFLEATCLLKDLEYDQSIHEPTPPKVPLKQHITRSKAGLGESRENTHKHEYKRTEKPVYNGKKIVYLACKCGYKEAIDLI